MTEYMKPKLYLIFLYLFLDAPYVNMRRMSQNTKRMAMMVWSMAEAATYVPNHYNNDLARRNPQDRDDDEGSQYGQ